jgi:hypothetical protein
MRSAGRLQLACGLVGLAMLGGLVIGQATTSPTAARASVSVLHSTGAADVPSTGEPSIFPRACYKRVIDLTRKYPQLDIVAVIDRECFSPHRAKTVSNRVVALPVCATAPRWEPAPSRRVSGCLVG